METNYRGFEIRQPVHFQRMPGAKGNGLTSITIKAAGGGILKTFQVKRYDNKDLEKAIQKAHNFIDDILAEGKPVEIISGPDKGKTGTIDALNRRRVDKKDVVFVVVNMDGDDEPFRTFKIEEIKYL